MSHCPAVHQTAVALIRRATWARPAHSSALSQRSTKIPACCATLSKASRLPGKRKRSRRRRLKKSCTRYQSPAQTKIWRSLLSSCQSQRWRGTTTRLRKKYGKKNQTTKHKPRVFMIRQHNFENDLVYLRRTSWCTINQGLLAHKIMMSV